MKSRLAMRGDLRLRVTRSHPTWRLRVADALAATLRRFGL